MTNDIPEGLLTFIPDLKTISKHYYYLLLIKSQHQAVIELNFN